MRAVASAFGLDRLHGEPQLLAPGEQGQAWAVSDHRGRWVIKQLSSARTPDRIADAVAFAASAGSRVPMPAMLIRSDGSSTLDGSEVGSPGTWFRVMEWLDLDDGDVEPEALGDLTARIHRVDSPAMRDIEPWFGRGLNDEDFEALLVAARAAEVTWVGDLQRCVPALGRLRVLTATRPGRPLVSHRDLNLSNVRRTRAGGVVVLDWDMCGPTDPRRELALALVQLEVSDAGTGVSAYRSYVGSGGPARIEGIDAFASVSIALDNLIHHYARRSLYPTDATELPRQRLSWLFDAVDLVTMPWLERFLGGLSVR